MTGADRVAWQRPELAPLTKSPSVPSTASLGRAGSSFAFWVDRVTQRQERVHRPGTARLHHAKVVEGSEASTRTRDAAPLGAPDDERGARKGEVATVQTASLGV